MKQCWKNSILQSLKRVHTQNQTQILALMKNVITDVTVLLNKE